MIAAGGGFAYVGSLHEGFPIAQSIAEQGYNAFVVKYRAGMGGQIATEDMAQAVEFVRKNAKMLQIDPNNYSVWGHLLGQEWHPISAHTAHRLLAQHKTPSPTA